LKIPRLRKIDYSNRMATSQLKNPLFFDLRRVPPVPATRTLQPHVFHLKYPKDGFSPGTRGASRQDNGP
jgi:hypothetical protein